MFTLESRKISIGRFSPNRLFILGGLVIAFLFGIYCVKQLFVHKDANEVLCVQSPLSGKLSFYTDDTGGVRWRGFGTVTRYPKQSQFWFSAKSDQGSKEDESIHIRFNDGGNASVSGSVSWSMPTDTVHLTLLQTKYGSYTAIQQSLIRTGIEKVVYLTGPLMSSKESNAEKRNDLLYYIEDQTQNGIYKTKTDEEKQPDPMTGQEKTVKVVRLVQNDKGQPVRLEESPLAKFGIITFNQSINHIVYDPIVEKQIQQQQELTMQVQTSVAEAKQAEQRAITTEKNGEADAATAKWKQEVIKAQQVTEANQHLEVARLDAQTAAQRKQEQILLGEGEAERKKLVMAADGALDKKLAAYIEVQKAYASAISSYQGNWVPTVVTGGSGNGVAGSGANQMMDILGMKAARDLGLDLTAAGAAQTRKK